MLLQSNGECYWKTQNKGYNILRLPSFYLDMPPLDLDRFELDSDDDNDIDMWCDNFWDLWLPTQRVVHNVSRSLDEILQLEIDLINSNTEFTPEEWIDRYAKRFRELLTDDPTLTEFQVKHALYLNY
mgnify:CR=1 FL=1